MSGSLGVAQSTYAISVGTRGPFIKSNVGAACTQAYTDPGLGHLAIQLLTLGYSPQKVITELGETDAHYQYRQIGIVDRAGRVAVHTGGACHPYSGAITGAGYVVMGNHLLTDEVVPAMDIAWQASEGQLFEDRLMAVITAGRDKGGDLSGHTSACILVYEDEDYSRTDLRIDYVPKREGQPDAVDALKELLDRWRPLIPYYKVRPHMPTIADWPSWLKEQGIPFQGY
jgi:uncharacterized Ntn-hydrolase superfamily protein